jgi:hypothetical protein
MWRNTRRYSTTSAYSSTNPPAPPSCSLSSHPTNIACNPSNSAIPSGYIQILHLPRWITITRVAVWLPRGNPLCGLEPMAAARYRISISMPRLPKQAGPIIRSVDHVRLHIFDPVWASCPNPKHTRNQPEFPPPPNRAWLEDTPYHSWLVCVAIKPRGIHSFSG